jgi:hypothetical protein
LKETTRQRVAPGVSPWLFSGASAVFGSARLSAPRSGHRGSVLGLGKDGRGGSLIRCAQP